MQRRHAEWLHVHPAGVNIGDQSVSLKIIVLDNQEAQRRERYVRSSAEPLALAYVHALDPSDAGGNLFDSSLQLLLQLALNKVHATIAAI